MNKVQNKWNKTAGYKTKSGAILYLLFELFKKIFPDVLAETGEDVVKYTIDLIILTGGLDWAWRNKKKIWDFIKDKFTKK